MSVPDYSQHTHLERDWFAESVLGAYANAYAHYLTERGYAAGTAASYLSCFAHFTHWFSLKQASLDDLSEDLITDFLDNHCALAGARKPFNYSSIP